MNKVRGSNRARILEHGTDLLSASGLGGVTLGVLAEQTGLSKSGLFAHFRSKQELDLALLEHAASIAAKYVVTPAMAVPEGLPRLKALVQNWLGWTAKAGLSGGCPVAAGMFELDDIEGPVRDRLLEMEQRWRGILASHLVRAIELGHLRRDTDTDQFVWELCGIYLSHHASLRFVKDRKADQYALGALNALFARWLPTGKAKTNSLARKTGQPRRAPSGKKAEREDS